MAVKLIISLGVSAAALLVSVDVPVIADELLFSIKGVPEVAADRCEDEEALVDCTIVDPASGLLKVSERLGSASSLSKPSS